MARLVAIDLGTHAVKVTVLRTSGKAVSVEARYAAPVPQQGAPVTLEQQLVALDALLEDHAGLTGSNVLAGLSLSSAHVSAHRLTLPFADPAQVEKTLPFAMEAEVPFDLDEMVLASRMVPAEGGANVFALVARHSSLEPRIEALAERGLDPRYVVSDADVISLLVPMGLAGLSGAVAVLNVGHQNTTVSVVKDGSTIWSRGVGVGGANLTRAIVRALGCPWSEAEALKHGERILSVGDIEDFAETDASGVGRTPYQALPGRVRREIDAELGLLLAEVRSTLISAEDALGIEVEAVLLTGGGARLKEVTTYLSRDLGLPIHRVTNADGVLIAGPMVVGHAVGQLLSGDRAVRERIIDLRVGELEYRGGTDLMRAALLYGTAGAAFFTVAAVALFVVQFVSLYRELGEVEQQVRDVVQVAVPDVTERQLESMDLAVGALREYVFGLELRADALGDGPGGVPPTIDLLYDLTVALPPSTEVAMEISDLVLSRSSVQFSAETDGYAGSAMITDRLIASERFKTAVKGSESKNSRGKNEFQITIPLEGVGSDTEEG